MPEISKLVELQEEHCRVGFRCKGVDRAYEMVACGRQASDCRRHESHRSQVGRQKACGWYRRFAASRGMIRHGIMTSFWTAEDVKAAYLELPGPTIPSYPDPHRQVRVNMMNDVAMAMQAGEDGDDSDENSSDLDGESVTPRPSPPPSDTDQHIIPQDSATTTVKTKGQGHQQVRFDVPQGRPPTPEGIDEHLWALAVDALTSTTKANAAKSAAYEAQTQELGRSMAKKNRPPKPKIVIDLLEKQDRSKGEPSQKKSGRTGKNITRKNRSTSHIDLDVPDLIP